MYYSESELAGLIKPTKLQDRPINPKSGWPYKKGTKKWWIWYYGLNPTDRNVLADLESQN